MALAALVLLHLGLRLARTASAAEYHWIVKEDVAAPDGYPRSIIAVMDARYLETSSTGGDAYNDRTVYHAAQQVPGPELRVRRGERVVVRVENQLPATDISIHWHGIHMRNQAWMDGTPGVTGCAIGSRGSTVYNFTVDQEPGTHWWHSHAGTQYADGLLGAIVIEPAEGEMDPVQKQNPYTDDQVLLLQDWLHETHHDISARYMTRTGAFSQTIGNETLPFLPDYPWPSSYVLLNGRGQTDCQMRLWEDCDKVRLYGWAYYFNHSERPRPAETLNGLPTEQYGQCMPERPPLMGQCNPTARPASLHCSRGGATRLRLVNTGFSMPLRFWIDRHRFTVVARDGLPIRPTGPHRALVISPGQRIDVVVPCDQDPAWRYKVFAMVALREFYPGADEINFEAFSYAVLGYDGGAGYDSTTESGVRVWRPVWCPACETTPLLEPEVSPRDFTEAGMTRGCTIGCDFRSRIYSSWQIGSKDYVPFAMEALMTPAGPAIAPPARERLVLSVGGGGNWWNNESDAASHFGLKFEWWSVNRGANWTNSHAPLAVPSEPIMLGRLFGRELGDVYGTADPAQIPFVQRLEYNRDAPITYEVVLINWEGQQHPWHLHGHSVQLVAQGWLDPDAEWRGHHFNASHVDVAASLGRLRGFAEAAPVLAAVDTFTTAPHSFVVFRLTANNPGAWMMHCHMDFHLEAGMGMLWSVEQDGLYPLPPPPDDFRICSRDATYGSVRALREGAGAALRLAASEEALWEAQAEIAALRRDKYLYVFTLVGLVSGLGGAALALLLSSLGGRPWRGRRAAARYADTHTLESPSASYISVRE